MLQARGKPVPGYWVLVNDETGQADLMMATAGPASKMPGSDWLARVQEGILRAKYPVPLEEFLNQVHATGIVSDSGGSTPQGRMFLEFTLRNESGTPARFELRCYIKAPKNWTDPKIVTGAELAYIDAAINRYVLTDGNN
jgi:hypothetical protein